MHVSALYHWWFQREVPAVFQGGVVIGGFGRHGCLLQIPLMVCGMVGPALNPQAVARGDLGANYNSGLSSFLRI